MMYYYRALKMLAFLDSASEMDIREGSNGFTSERSPSTRGLSRADSSLSLRFKGHEDGIALMKYTYVVACQIYGAQKAKKDPQADEILYLMKNNAALRVAYVDEVFSGRDEKEYYSVLVKYDQQLQKEVEIYRIKLPGPLKLGEGKPENQNHAFIFTRGDAVQTIDMNQDNYFEEALKMRNLLEEYRHYYGIRKPTSWEFWFLTRGGISKASRVINISEDIFAGFNCTLRGGNVTHHEYIQVGKGRDVGLNQISMFEAKVSSGNGEQILSRDVYSGVEASAMAMMQPTTEHLLQLSSVFYTFSMGTRAHYFGRTILHGGAKYRATGRGFVVQHKSFAENYRLYARSHFVKAIELGLALGDVWIMAPFVFNPSGFDWLKTVYDFDDFMDWIWFLVECLQKLSRAGKNGVGIVYQLDIAAGSKSIVVYLLSWIYMFVAVGIYFTRFTLKDFFTSLLAFIPTGWGLILIAQVLRPFLQKTIIWEIVISVARLYDILFGVIVMAPVALLSWMPGLQSMQTRILFNEAFSRGLKIFQI
ncbi:hypothetical protein C3L33_11997, partial [Rhododendron williamsianum]